MKNTSKISHWFLFLVATNPQHIQPSDSSTAHTQQELSWNLQQPKSSQEGDPQFHPFANILRTQFWCSLFLRHLFTCKRASLLTHNPTARNHHKSKTSCSCDTSVHKNKAPEEPQVHSDSSNICLLLIWIFTSFFFMESQQVPLCPQQRQGPNFGRILRH